jgi:enediyne biosynthesis protein E4
MTLLALVLLSCAGDDDKPALFELLEPSRTGITFENHLPEDTTFNILNYLNYYNGGGVAAGDIDGDGRPDLFFTSNLGKDRLYLNKGDYRFEDITEHAGVGGDTTGWTSGVTMADVNGDGRLDIYVSSVNYLTRRGRNVFYVNNGDSTFTDRTREYGLEHVGYSTQAAFFDYDVDGDLDMYLLNHSVHTERGVSTRPQREPRHPRAGDRLFRNDPAPDGSGQARRFTDVSADAGIHGGVEGYGLGVVVSDVDLDGCPDIYVANDFQENDFLYMNDCRGKFTESIARSMGHTSRSSMGVDAADFNNDGRPDIVVVDMLPEREEVLKTSANAESFTVHELKRRAGYHDQYARNTLQLNRGGGRFSDIGYLAGVHATDWSWSALFADLDNDGFKDLFVTNGIYRRPNDLDFINYVGHEAVQASLARGISRNDLRLLQLMPQIPLPNHAYRNNGDLTFTDRATEWGLAQPGFSNGAVYVDLNDSGALDLVVNRINAPAAIYRSRAREVNGNHYLQVALRGDGANASGIGAKVMLTHAGRTQLLEQMPTRGFQSSVDQRLHFGLGSTTTVDTLVVVWPDQRYQVMTGVGADRTITLSQSNASGRFVRSHDSGTSRSMFSDVTARVGVSVAHRENDAYDYNREPLMPHLLSREGPALAVADVNGDGLDDLYVGGAKWQPGTLLLQRRNGSFQPSAQPSLAADSLNEDVDAAFFDADGDSDSDLYVVSGGNEFWGEADALRDRLYLNDGRGSFQRSTNALPLSFENGSCVVPADFDGDGRVDLFVGARVVSRQYGLIPRSRLLHNVGGGRFIDVTKERAPALERAGLVTSAAWIDYDGDRQLDLVVAGEWMPVRVFRQEKGHFTDRTESAGLAKSEGWWSSVATADLDADGRSDLVLGNLGLNSYIKAKADEPARLYVADFFDNGTIEQILTFYRSGVSYPMGGRDDLVKLMPQLRSRYTSYSAFGASRIDQILPANELRKATILEARNFATSIALNRGGRFTLQPLPAEAQFAPVYATLSDDFDGDGRTDLMLAGNFSGVTPVRGSYDASRGLLLRGSGDGRFVAVDWRDSRLDIPGEVRDLRTLRHAGGGRLIAVARNDSTLLMLSVASPDSTEP